MLLAYIFFKYLSHYVHILTNKSSTSILSLEYIAKELFGNLLLTFSTVFMQETLKHFSSPWFMLPYLVGGSKKVQKYDDVI